MITVAAELEARASGGATLDGSTIAIIVLVALLALAMIATAGYILGKRAQKKQAVAGSPADGPGLANAVWERPSDRNIGRGARTGAHSRIGPYGERQGPACKGGPYGAPPATPSLLSSPSTYTDESPPRGERPRAPFTSSPPACSAYPSIPLASMLRQSRVGSAAVTPDFTPVHG